MLNRRHFVLALAVGASAPPLCAQTPTPQTHRVEIKNFTFEPARVEARVGDIVEWINLDFAPHTATDDNNGWDTGQLKKDEKGRLTTTHPGTLAYHCAFHPNMKAVIAVAT